MRIGLIDVDGHNYPNLALMKLSAYHKSIGDTVEWWKTDFVYYDIVYMSKVFSDEYSPDVAEPINAGRVIKGGSGYSIQNVDGIEIYGKPLNLPYEIEHIYPDYSLYPELTKDTAYGFLSRGCPRGCKFCHVAAKEGRKSHKVADLSEFWHGQGNIVLMDPNILACKDRIDLLNQLKESGARVDFNQGLDIRFMTKEIADLLGQIRVKSLHFAWDNADEDLTPYFSRFADWYHRKSSSGKIVYVLTNFGSTMEQNLYRIYTLKEMGYDPYVMVYNKPSAPKEIKRLQRWCNNRIIFGAVPRFEDYKD